MKKDLIRIAIVVALILLIPLFGNLIVDGWNWSIGDFIIMGTLLFCTSLAINFTIKQITHPIYRILACAFIVLVLLAIWAELAVDAVSQLLNFLF